MSENTLHLVLRPEFIPEGAFSYPVNNPLPTRWFGFLLLPEFTLLAFGAALDPLRIANQLAQKPLYGWLVLSEDGAAVSSSSGVDVSAHAALKDLTTETHLFACSGNNGHKTVSDSVLGHMRRHSRFGGKVGGICTGATALARAGLLAGKKFTLHWENQPAFCEAFPDLTPSSQRFEHDGDLMTCGGGTAATEMMISIIAKDYGGDFAIAVSDMCLSGSDIATRSEQRTSIAKAISSRNPKILVVLRAMYNNIENPLQLKELADSAGFSRRQMERQFNRLLNEAPAQTYRNIRLDRARMLLMETDLSVMEISMAVGFNSNGIFSRHYKARFGVSPYGHRGTAKITRRQDGDAISRLV